MLSCKDALHPRGGQIRSNALLLEETGRRMAFGSLSVASAMTEDGKRDKQEQ